MLNGANGVSAGAGWSVADPDLLPVETRKQKINNDAFVAHHYSNRKDDITHKELKRTLEMSKMCTLTFSVSISAS